LKILLTRHSQAGERVYLSLHINDVLCSPFAKQQPFNCFCPHLTHNMKRYVVKGNNKTFPAAVSESIANNMRIFQLCAKVCVLQHQSLRASLNHSEPLQQWLLSITNTEATL